VCVLCVVCVCLVCVCLCVCVGVWCVCMGVCVYVCVCVWCVCMGVCVCMCSEDTIIMPLTLRARATRPNKNPLQIRIVESCVQSAATVQIIDCNEQQEQTK